MNLPKAIKNTNKVYLATIILVCIFLFYRGVNFLDPDFGWHLTAGKLILASGFPETDPFSYTMPSFPFINHEWLNDIVVAKLFPIFGWLGMSFLFTLFCVIAILLCVRRDISEYCTSMLFIFGIASLEPYFGVSPRVFSWLFFAVATFIILNRKTWEKYWWTVPLITLLWTNLHGSFPLVIIVLAIVFIVRSLSIKKIQTKELLTTALSLLVSFVNPYGYKLWWLVWLTVSDSSIKSRILEWQPTLTSLDTIPLPTFFLVAISFVLIYKYRRRFSSEKLLLNIFFFIFALTAVRNIPFWIIVDLPMVAMGINYFYKDLKKIEDAKRRFLETSRGVFALSAGLLILQFGFTAFHISNYFNERVFYPSDAVDYLSHNLPLGQIFSEYNWGGYLVWKLPQKEVFVDGLMPTWRLQAVKTNESGNAMDDYINIISNKTDYKPFFTKYGIDTVLLSKVSKDNTVQNLIKRYFFTQEDHNSSDAVFSFERKLKEDGWKIVYQDSTAIIFQR